jgi:RHS repeat-associated protein
MKNILSISILFLAFVIPTWSQTTLTIYPDKDAMIRYTTYPNNINDQYTNFWTYSYIMTYQWTWSGYPVTMKSLIGIDLSSLPDNANITDAKLYLYESGGHQTNLTAGSSSYKSNASYLRRITTSWSESAVTWNTAPTTVTNNQVTLSNSSTTDQDYVVDVTNLIKDIQANPTTSDGLMMSLVTEAAYTEMQFASSDHATSSLHPKLEITYTTGVSYPDYESFEFTETKWEDTDGDDTDWTLRSGTTPSSITGPSSSSHGNYYAYVEASSPNYPGKTAYLESPSYDLSDKDNATILFDYHMYGSTMGQLELQISTNGGTSWSSSSIWSKSGDQGNSWHEAEVDLSLYAGQSILLRFKATTGSSYRSDIALDHIILTVNIEANPSAAENYIMTTVAMSELGASGPLQQSVQYFDGLGRPLQKVHVGNNPEGKDLVKPMKYDNQGRFFHDYLSFAAGDGENGTFRDYETSGDDALTMQEEFYQDHLGLGSTDPYAYSKPIYEESPLNRLLAQGAPGSDWQPSGADGLSGHTLRYDYSTNTSSTNDDIRLFTISGTTCTSSDYYDDEELYATVTYSEDYDAAANEYALTVEYKDKQGRVILKEAFLSSEPNPLRTYYIYDDYGLLRYVFPPEFSDTFSASSGTLTYYPTTTGIKNFCYYYAYDARKRMIEKQLPGAEKVYMVYDHRDRLVGSQDGELRNSNDNEWIMTKYDELNRPVITARVGFSSAVSQTIVQGFITTFYNNTSNEEFEVYNGSGIGYSDQSYPNLSSAYSSDILSLTFYDNYDFRSSLSEFSGLTFDVTNNIDVYEDEDGSSNGYFDRVTGQVTGTSVLILDGADNKWIQSITYYDDKYRVIQTQSDLHPNGKSMVSTEYDFMGNPMQVLEIQTVSSVTNKVRYVHTYDHVNRLKDTYVYYNNDNAVNLSQNSYNELGQLAQKKLHSENNNDFVQTVDYGYNIRGWLTSINDPGNLGDDKFGMQLFYQNITDNPGSEEKYNGNISGISWMQDGGSLVGYGYSYDELNRITTGNYNTHSGSNWVSSNNFTTNYSYYNNGNIKTLTRRNELGNLIDNATYTYTGNKLMEVVDSESSSLGIHDDDVSGEDYYYDDNGNMIKDLNKSIEIDYNYLNLPEKVFEEGGSGDEISYIYDANGIKWLKKVDNSSLKDIAYCGSFVYEDVGSTGTFSLDYIITPEGKIDNLGASIELHYNLKDHLGNTRVEFDKNGNNQQVDYYPFGMTFSNSLGGENKYLFNSKELQDEQLGGVNLDHYDYGARFYDPALGRWHVVDPAAEIMSSWSPYNYTFNNPIRFIDPDGTVPDDFYFDEDHRLIKYVENDEPDRVFVATGETTIDGSSDSPMPEPVYAQVEMSSGEIEQNMNANGYDKVTEEQVVEFTEMTTYYTDSDGSNREPSKDKTVNKILDQESMYVRQGTELQGVESDHMYTIDRNHEGSYMIERGVEQRTYNYGQNGTKSQNNNIDQFIIFVIELIGTIM